MGIGNPVSHAASHVRGHMSMATAKISDTGAMLEVAARLASLKASDWTIQDLHDARALFLEIDAQRPAWAATVLNGNIRPLFPAEMMPAFEKAASTVREHGEIPFRIKGFLGRLRVDLAHARNPIMDREDWISRMQALYDIPAGNWGQEEWTVLAQALLAKPSIAPGWVKDFGLSKKVEIEEALNGAGGVVSQNRHIGWGGAMIGHVRAGLMLDDARKIRGAQEWEAGAVVLGQALQRNIDSLEEAVITRHEMQTLLQMVEMPDALKPQWARSVRFNDSSLGWARFGWAMRTAVELTAEEARQLSNGAVTTPGFLINLKEIDSNHWQSAFRGLAQYSQVRKIAGDEEYAGIVQRLVELPYRDWERSDHIDMYRVTEYARDHDVEYPDRSGRHVVSEPFYFFRFLDTGEKSIDQSNVALDFKIHFTRDQYQIRSRNDWMELARRVAEEEDDLTSEAQWIRILNLSASAEEYGPDWAQMVFEGKGDRILVANAETRDEDKSHIASLTKRVRYSLLAFTPIDGPHATSQALEAALRVHPGHSKTLPWVKKALVQAREGVDRLVIPAEIEDVRTAIHASIERNIERIDNPNPDLADGYMNFPDYGQLGETVADIELLEALADTSHLPRQ